MSHGKLDLSLRATVYQLCPEIDFVCLNEVYVPCWEGQGREKGSATEPRKREAFEGCHEQSPTSHWDSWTLGSSPLVPSHSEAGSASRVLGLQPPCFLSMLLGFPPPTDTAREGLCWMRVLGMPGPGAPRPPTVVVHAHTTSFLKSEITSFKHGMREMFDKEILKHRLKQVW